MKNFVQKSIKNAHNLVDSDRTQNSVVDIIQNSECDIFVVSKAGPYWTVREGTAIEEPVETLTVPIVAEKKVTPVEVVATEQPKKKSKKGK